MLKIAVFVSGSGSNLQSLIDATHKGSINGEIVLVVSNRKNAYGLERARNASINAEMIKDQDVLIRRLQEEEVDLIVLAGYLAIIPEKLVQLYPHRIINIHPSLIPAFCGPGYYGIHVHEAALKRGVKVSGATVHFVNEEVDGGPIVIQETVDIADLNSANDIQQRVLEIEHRILPEAVKLFCEGKIIVEEGRTRIL